jgi:hypothetical protein
MTARHGPYHRTGAPGGPGCRVAALPVFNVAPDGTEIHRMLLDAGEQATELELLRTVASGMGVQWGKDDLGWWAAVPAPPPSNPG